MTNPDLPILTYNILKKLNALADEIECCHQNLKFEQARIKAEKLKQLFVQYFNLNELHLEFFFESAFDESEDCESAEAIRRFIFSVLVAGLSESKYFDKIESAVKNAARDLTLTTRHLNHERAVNAIKFEFIVEFCKTINSATSIQAWRETFTEYLEDKLQFNHDTTREIINVAGHLAANLVKDFQSDDLFAFYAGKIIGEVILLLECFVDYSMANSDDLDPQLTELSQPLFKQLRLICDQKQPREENQIELGLGTIQQMMGAGFLNKSRRSA